MKRQPYCRFPLAVQPTYNLRASTIVISILVGVLLAVGLMLIAISL